MSNDKKIILSTPPQGAFKAQADFNQSDADGLVYQKGNDVIHEKALQCPCKGKNTNQQSNCKNCGGCGWVFINPTQTRMVVHSMNRNTQYKDWSEENRGTASITAMAREDLSFMDRVLVKSSLDSYSQVLFLKKLSTTNFFYTTYPIVELNYIALFEGTDKKLRRLEKTLDYTFEGNNIYLNSKFDNLDSDQDLSITVRYKHYPQYHILDIPREAFSSIPKQGGYEGDTSHLPINCIGKKVHYVLDQENLAGNRIFDNSYKENCDVRYTK